jgi:4-hydroxy-tetrahydrodipicolinate synthase
MANLFPERLRALYDTHAEDKALCREVDLIVSRPVIPALKLAMASLTGLADWRHLRAPLQSLDGTDRDQIESTFAERAPAP